MVCNETPHPRLLQGVEDVLVSEPKADDRQLDALYRAHSEQLVRVAFLLTGSHAAAEDAVHDVFIRCADRLDGLDHPLSYLRTAVVNECRTQHRRDRTVAGPVPEVPSLPDRVIETLDALDGLPEMQRAAVVLRYFIDLPEAEIAEILDCRPATVRSHVHRAITHLRTVLS